MTNQYFTVKSSPFDNETWNQLGKFSDWNQPTYTPLEIENHKLASKATNTPVTLLSTIVSSSNGIGGGGKSSGAVLAPNGKIYMGAQNPDKIIEFDPATNTMQFVGPSFGGSSAKYFAGCLAPNGKIYFAGGRFASYVQFDPDTYTAVTTGVTGITASPFNSFWGAIVTAPNGFVYMIPRRANQIVKINPVDNTYTLVGNVLGDSKYRGAVVGADGKIYCVPRAATQILIIDPTDDSLSFLGDFSSLGGDKWEGASLASNGKIYCMPSGGMPAIGGLYTVLVINTNNQTTYFIYSQRTMAQCTTGPDGNIYGSSLWNNPGYYFQLNTTSDTFTWSSPQSGLLFQVSHIGAVVGADGAIYLVPYDSSFFYRISEPQTIDPDRALSRFYNKGL